LLSGFRERVCFQFEFSDSDVGHGKTGWQGWKGGMENLLINQPLASRNIRYDPFLLCFLNEPRPPSFRKADQLTEQNRKTTFS
jgi:hypothetical protein